MHVEFRAFLPGIEKKTDRSKLLLPHVSDDVATSTGTISRFFEKRRGDIYIYICLFFFFPRDAAGRQPPSLSRFLFFVSSPCEEKTSWPSLAMHCAPS